MSYEDHLDGAIIVVCLMIKIHTANEETTSFNFK